MCKTATCHHQTLFSGPRDHIKIVLTLDRPLTSGIKVEGLNLNFDREIELILTVFEGTHKNRVSEYTSVICSY